MHKLSMGRFVKAELYPYPYNGDLRSEKTVLLFRGVGDRVAGLGTHV